MKNKRVQDWILRFVKGMFIGSGAILPGVSGGALAAVFGIYERLISFIAHLNNEFRKNFIYFLPVGLGGVFGIFLLSFAISYFFETAETQIVWFFIGCIVGTIPALLKQAAKKGRKPQHLVIMSVTAVLALYFLKNAQSLINGSIPLNFGTWLIAGAIVGLGMIVPGLSPSNFLVYLNMYKPMTDGIKALDFMVILPLGAGVVLTVLALSKIMNHIFGKAYAGMYHTILGIVFASTVMIIPLDYNYRSLGALVGAGACVAGIILGSLMSRLEEKYKTEE